jgi:hypothetical protein
MFQHRGIIQAAVVAVRGSLSFRAKVRCGLIGSSVLLACLTGLMAPGWAGGSGMTMQGTVPEPASGAILAVGVGGILWYRRRSRRTRRAA